MGTRSLTFVYDGAGKPNMIMYRHMDGYPSGHGKELAKFLEPIVMVNGLGGSKMVANGAGCLAAQIVAHFKDGPGGIYLENGTDRGQDYEYAVICNRDMPISVKVLAMRYNAPSELLFSGTVSDFKTFCEKGER